MDLQLKDKVILVTGGASGIGAAISLALAQEGAIPVVLGKSPMTPAFEAQLCGLQNQAVFHQIELTDDAACKQAVADTAGRFGHIDGLVNNAGINDNIGLDAGREAFIEAVPDTDDPVMANYLTCKEITPDDLHAAERPPDRASAGPPLPQTGEGLLRRVSQAPRPRRRVDEAPRRREHRRLLE